MFDPRDPTYTDVVSFARSPDALRDAIREAVTEEPRALTDSEVSARRALLNDHVRYGETAASEEVERFVRRFIASTNKS
jgi:hypothetical protein